MTRDALRYSELLEAANTHGRESAPDHEVGDLQDLLRAALRVMSDKEEQRFYASDEVLELMGRWGADPEEDEEDWPRRVRRRVPSKNEDKDEEDIKPHVCLGVDDDDRPLQPERTTCGRCNRSWCERCDPGPSALCHYCHGRGHSTAPLAREGD